MKYLEKIEKAFEEVLGFGVAEFERMYDALCEETLEYYKDNCFTDEPEDKFNPLKAVFVINPYAEDVIWTEVEFEYRAGCYCNAYRNHAGELRRNEYISILNYTVTISNPEEQGWEFENEAEREEFQAFFSETCPPHFKEFSEVVKDVYNTISDDCMGMFESIVEE